MNADWLDAVMESVWAALSTNDDNNLPSAEREPAHELTDLGRLILDRLRHDDPLGEPQRPRLAAAAAEVAREPNNEELRSALRSHVESALSDTDEAEDPTLATDLKRLLDNSVTVASLQRRMKQAESGDPGPVTEPAALGELVSLIRSENALYEGLPLLLIHLVGSFHFYRAKAKPQGVDKVELWQSITMMSRHIDGNTGVEFDRNYFAFLANEYLASVFGGADDRSRQDAIHFASDVVDVLYEVHPARPALLANLALNHEARFAAFAERRDLDQAIARARSSLALLAEGQPERHAVSKTLINLLHVRLEEGGKQGDSEELAALRSAPVSAPGPARELSGFTYDLRALSMVPAAFGRVIERSVAFPSAKELAQDLSETKAGDFVVDTALKRLHVMELADSLVDSAFSRHLAVKLHDEVGDSIVFALPLIGNAARILNVGLGNSDSGRRLWQKLTGNEVARNMSVSTLCRQWDWASQIYADLVADEGASSAIRDIAHSEGGCELAGLLGGDEEGISFIGEMVDNLPFLGLAGALLSSDVGRRFLVDLSGSPAMERLIETLLDRDDAREALTAVSGSRYVTEVLAGLEGGSVRRELCEAIADSARRSRLAERLAAALNEHDVTGALESPELAALLLPSLLALILSVWLASVGVTATVEIVYVAAVIAVTERVAAPSSEGVDAQSGEELWIPPKTNLRPPPDSDQWRRVAGARLKQGVPAVEASDLEPSEGLAGAVHGYMMTKDLSQPSPDHEDRILLQLAQAWYLTDLRGDEEWSSFEGEDRLAYMFGAKIRSGTEEAGIDVESIQAAVRAALEETSRDRWKRRIEDILINLAATGIAALIAEAVARLMHLAPSADAQVYEIDMRVAQEIDRLRDGSNWTSHDELALIFCIHALSVATIAGVYERRYVQRGEPIRSEAISPPLRLNTEFHAALARQLGVEVSLEISPTS